MRSTRIYQPGEFTPGEIIPLSPAASQHVGRVLRMEIGDNITLFNGNNFEFQSTIVTINKREVSVSIENRTYLSRESNLIINLAQGIAKGDKMDFVIQKAIELGVTNIIPILSERCVVNLSHERLTKKHKQWQDQTISACEQCGRNFLPTIHEPSKLSNFLETCDSLNKFVLSPVAKNSWHYYANTPQQKLAVDLQQQPNLKNAITILIGPEGGLSHQELKLAEQFNFKPVNLGPRILRTETAAITTVSIIQTLFGDI